MRTTGSKLGRRDFLKGLGLAGTAAALGSGLAGCPAAAGKPNIVLIVADDLGYADLGVQGCKDIPTPNIDSLAYNGVQFTNGYVSCPVCSPTRAGIMTGRYPQRFGYEVNPAEPDASNMNYGLPLSEPNIAERLKPLGYATGIFGKWHLGVRPEMLPLQRGFDEFFGFLGASHSYIDALAGTADVLLNGKEPVTEIDYTTDAFTREAVSFIDRHKSEPFFLYLPYNAVHAPLQSIQKYLDRFNDIADPNRHIYAAMLSAMDDGVGQVLAKLNELGLEENTLLFFISDNGGPTPYTTSRNAPLRGCKEQVLEGGIRTPSLIQWKGHIAEAKAFEQPVISLDIHATILAAVGIPFPQDKKLDGVDLVPYLNGEQTGAPHDRLFWRFDTQWAIRMGEWKLENGGDGVTHLYNLANDIAEMKDLAATNHAKVDDLQTAYDAWNATLMAPLWKRAVPQEEDDPAQ